MRWKLQLLGEFGLTRGEDGAGHALRRHERALLAYLALNPRRRESRERLAALLWGDKVDDSARRSLRQCIAGLRKALDDAAGAILLKDSDPLVFDDAAFEVDARDFERLAAAGTREALEQAVALYRGDLLDGLSLHADGFESWVAPQRAVLRQRAADAWVALMTLQAAEGDAGAAMDAARRVIELDPLREEAHRLLMQGLVESGRRGEAVRQYQSLVELLHRELEIDIEPEPETVRLLRAIVTAPGGNDAGEPEPSTTRPTTAAPTTPAPPTASLTATATATATAPRMFASPLPPARRLRLRRWIWVQRALFGLFGAALASLAVATAVYWNVPQLAPAPLGAVIAEIKAGVGDLPLVPEQPSLVVLPFKAVGEDETGEALADGISEGVTTALTLVSEIFVIARHSALAYEDRNEPVERVAKDLAVRYVLDGSVQKSGNRVRVHVTLLDARQRPPVWTESYDENIGADLFELQDRITRQVLTSLQVSLTEGEQERVSNSFGTSDVQAWLAVGQGFKLLRHIDPEDNARARTHYERAAALDPNYAAAWDGLAWTHLLEARFGWGTAPEVALGQAAAFAERAVAAQPDRSRNNSLLGTLALMSGDFAAAVQLGERAVELQRNDADAAALLAYTLTFTGEPERARGLVRKAMQLSPYYPEWYRWLLGRANRLAGRGKEAIDILAVPGKGAPSPARLIELAIAYAEAGDPGKARLAGAEVLSYVPGFSIAAWTRFPPYADADMAAREAVALRTAGLPE